MKAVKITDKVFWVGAIDWNINDFHGYSINKGTTYNAFLVLGSKTVLIDTVKSSFFGEMKSRISDIIDPTKIDTIISNHAEMDHSGSLPMAVKEFKPSNVLASKMGVKALKQHFGEDFAVNPVETASSINIGDSKFTFLDSRMLHWPDSMVTFLENDGTLFSNDIFGMHLASSNRFDDDTTQSMMYEAEKYYANIILPMSKVVLMFLKQFKQSGIVPKIIAPDHGPIWRKDPMKIVSLYEKWALQKNDNKAVVVYDTMWGSTEKLAYSIADGIINKGTEVKVLKASVRHRSDIATEMLNAGALVVGSPIINTNIYPAIADILCYLKGLNKENLVGGIFGSYGWIPKGLEEIKAKMNEMKVELVDDIFHCSYIPSEDMLKKSFLFGEKIATKLQRKIK